MSGISVDVFKPTGGNYSCEPHSTIVIRDISTRVWVPILCLLLKLHHCVAHLCLKQDEGRSLSHHVAALNEFIMSTEPREMSDS